MYHANMFVPPKSLGITEKNPMYLEIGVSVLIAILEDNIEAIEEHLLKPQVRGLEREVVLDGLGQRRALLAKLQTIDPELQPNVYSGIWWAPDTDMPMPNSGQVH